MPRQKRPTQERTQPLRVVITGASSGIGQATAELLAKRGARLVLAARNAEALQTVAGRCEQLGGEAICVPTDVTDSEAVRVLAERAAADLGGVDVWVSNAGTGAVGRYEETPMQSHEQVIRINLIGHMNDAHAVLPTFLRQGHGIFINMISLGGFAAAPFAAAYSAGKFGLRGFAEALRGELAQYPDIHVCDVYPGFVDTPGLRHGANYVGRRISAPPPVLDARRVAEAIGRLCDKPRPTTVIGGSAVLTRVVHAANPVLTARIAARLMQSYFDRAEPVATSDGNLFDPSADAAVIDGGLRKPARGIAAGTFAVGSLAAAAGALALARTKSHR
ncbi:SDR family oxidoreductase [Mycobacterium sp. ITM-2016-00317]|uniref:SDR family oxidoreductase n=1 Tax=Mycobacterium sp. ITM-2016-00317 TaxID=2099694 RepID=UPI000D417C11|nr:SDR family oxidoreductase [Mycobacterium sp. ITM-2016-00317]WNG89743.1 SDR family oxidoreductase [Mycobacterium sp. ITM-2016-00317]